MGMRRLTVLVRLSPRRTLVTLPEAEPSVRPLSDIHFRERFQVLMAGFLLA